MKTKFSRILGIALTIAMVASLFVFAIPAAAEPGETIWATQDIPSATNNVVLNASDVGDIAVSNDGTIYVINNDDAMFAALANSVLKSTDGGQSFSGLAAVGGGAALFLRAIAVAPDNSDALAVTDGANVFVSNNGGTTWTQLPAKNTAGEIMDIDVSPAIAGGIVARHYVIGIADAATATTTGQAEIYGPAATWTVIAAVGAGDYMACKFSPSYVGDRALAVVWNAGGGVTNLSIVTQPGEAAEALTRTSAIGTASIDYDNLGAGGCVANTQVAADIAMPSDWDSSLASGEVTYVSIASTAAAVAAGVADRGGAVAITTGTATDDVYRIDAGVAVDLNGSNTVPVHSIAYSGTIDDGTLFLGTRLAPSVRYTLNPTSMAPTWKTTQKAPTGDNIAAPEACTKVVVAPNGDIYAGTRDAWTTAGAAADRRSAFSISTDAGATFNQTALIDTGAANVVQLDSVMLTPDGAEVFLATDDGTDLSLWKSATPTTSTSWERIYCRTAAGPGLVRLAPDYADAPSVFWFNTAAANLWVSHDGGALFSNRVPPAVPQDMTVESGGSSGVVYMASGTNMYKSDNGGYFFGLAVPGEAGAIISLAMAPSYPAMPIAGNVLVGGTGAVTYSTDSAASFTLIDTGLAAASTYIVYAHEDYATNNVIFAGDSLAAGTGNTFRYEIGVSPQWDDMISNAAAADEVLGLGMNNGAVYSLSAAVHGVERTLRPLDPLGLIAWDTGNTGLVAPGALTVAAQPNILTVADNFLYFCDRTAAAPVLWALQDTMATVVPVISTPVDGGSIAIDPVNGRGVITTVAWAAMGTGGGMVDTFEVWADLPSTGFIGTTQGAVVVGDATAPNLTVGPAVGTGARPVWASGEEYMIRVRARNTINNGGLRSNWSDVINVTIQSGGIVQAPHVGPQLLGPTGGATGVSLNPGFSWTPIAGATEYEFILATDAALTEAVEDTPVYVNQPSWQVPAGTLEYNTQYFWGVKATEPTESPQSIGTFRTLISELYECPFCSETFTTAGALESHIAAMHPAATPAYIWAIIIIGAILMIAVIVLILKTRRVT